VREGLIRPLWLAAVVIAFCLPLFYGLGRTDMENDEAIYSYAVDGIVARGNWLNPLSSPHDDAIFLEKPPLKFWIVAAPIVLGLTPANELGMRVWDALFGSLAFIYVFLFGRRLAGGLCGFIAVLVLFVYGPLLFEHGLRNNNMEAPLVLSYCGAIYHYLAWSTAESRSRRWTHVLAASLYFLLGFMTKFVAAGFLPILILAATLFVRDARKRLVQDWKLWAIGAAVFLVLASPWFIYQQIAAGSHFWRVILGDHVYLRMTVAIDPSHIQPWNFYYKTIFRELQYSGTTWLVIAGGALLAGVGVWTRRLDLLLTIAWFAVPLAIMSAGTSKLHHYAYPFLPPLALAAGYGPGLLYQKAWSRVDMLTTRLQQWIVSRGLVGPVLRSALLALAAAALAIAVATVVLGQIDINVGGTRYFRNSHAARPLTVALVLATVAGRGAIAARLLLPLALLISILPAEAYEGSLRRTAIDEHPMRSARDCLVRVRAQEVQAHPQAPGIYAIGEQKWMLHSHYYYFRHVGTWERSENVLDAEVLKGLFVPGQQRPILIGDADYQAFKARHPEGLQSLSMLRLREVLLLMPGPYAACDPNRPSSMSMEP
jgi:4-amino-4-deoxy-L-arabinose transferase-like glycosyltransferase